MTDGVPGHVDESGAPCTHHAPVRPEVLVTLALVGSRATGFNHDFASKLQGLLMMLEDLVERLAERGEPELHRAAQEASAAAQDLAELVTVSRQLTRNPGPSRRPLRDLIAASCARAGVELNTQLVDAEVEAVMPHAIHAVALAIEVAGGPGRARALDAECRRVDGRIELVVSAASKTTTYASEFLALAAAILRRDGGDVRCGADRIVIWLQAA
ncbi:MAG TPA: hypothetical protein VNO30_03385 [Kofleriaceae bacterium]|nr:hypothetical protein [Kofleriaceae bacterium]